MTIYFHLARTRYTNGAPLAMLRDRQNRHPRRERLSSTHAQLIVAVLRDVAHPWQRLVAALLHDLEIPHLDARDREIGDLEFDRDRLLGHLVVQVHCKGRSRVSTGCACRSRMHPERLRLESRPCARQGQDAPFAVCA